MTAKQSTFPETIRHAGAVVLALALCTLGLGLLASAQTIITYDAPGAGTSAGQGTFGIALTPSQVIVGEYIDSSGVAHGFLRSRAGTVTTFDVPEAGTGAGQGTVPESINPAGAVAGYYADDTGLNHGFVRAPDGAIITFDAPGAGTAAFCPPPVLCGNGTQAVSINPAGAVSGQFADTSGVFHGFLRSPDGAITTFDDSNAGTAPGQGTVVTFTDGINPAGAIAGGYIDSNNLLHAVIRTADGAITEFEVPGAVNGENNSGINPVGTVTSFYVDANLAFHGYIRSRDGAFTLFDISGGGTGAFQGTEPLNINASGAIVGAVIDGSGVDHGFLRTKEGRITKFDAPGAGTGTGQGTIPFNNNPSNAITGFVIDGNGVAHGFLRTP